MMEQAIAELYQKLNTELVKWCSIMTQDEDLAREMVQEGFLRAIDHYCDIRDRDFNQQRAWLYRTIKNIFIDYMRKRKNESLYGEAKGEYDSWPYRSSFDNYSEKEIMCVLESMDVLEAKILILRHVDGYSSKQIGEMLGLPAGTARSKLHEARAHLKELL